MKTRETVSRPSAKPPYKSPVRCETDNLLPAASVTPNARDTRTDRRKAYSSTSTCFFTEPATDPFFARTSMFHLPSIMNLGRAS